MVTIVKRREWARCDARPLGAMQTQHSGRYRHASYACLPSHKPWRISLPPALDSPLSQPWFSFQPRHVQLRTTHFLSLPHSTSHPTSCLRPLLSGLDLVSILDTMSKMI